MGRIKGWEKDKEKKDFVSWKTIATKDYNVGTPKYLQSKDSIFHREIISIQKQWSMKDYPNWNEKNALWTVRFFSGKSSINFKTKQKAQDYVMKYMKSHPNG